LHIFSSLLPKIFSVPRMRVCFFMRHPEAERRLIEPYNRVTKWNVSKASGSGCRSLLGPVDWARNAPVPFTTGLLFELQSVWAHTRESFSDLRVKTSDTIVWWTLNSPEPLFYKRSWINWINLITYFYSYGCYVYCSVETKCDWKQYKPLRREWTARSVDCVVLVPLLSLCFILVSYFA
jgi:hypothetical protein